MVMSLQDALRARLTALDPKLYPFENHYLELPGNLRYHYLDEGSGDPVVMVHGNPSWSLYYRNLVQALKGNCRCIVPDHIGCGFSDKPGDAQYPYTLKRRVDDLEQLLEHLNLRENLTLVLHDWGGMIGMAFASRHPERIKRLVILNTSAFHLPKTKPFPWQLWLTRTPLGALMVRGFNMFSRSATKMCVTRKKMTPALRQAYTAPYDSWAHRIATLRFVQDIPLKISDPGYTLVSEVENGLARFQSVPMLIAWGDRDFVFDKHFLALWTKTFPKAQLNQFPDCGHYVLEDAGDEIATLVRDFFAAHPVGAGAPSDAGISSSRR